MSHVNLKICGAAKEVTGSNLLLQYPADDSSQKQRSQRGILLDCGLVYRGSILNAFRENRREFPYDPRQIDAILVTHAHVDHCGRIPLLVSCVKDSFRAAIYGTLQTNKLLPIMWEDTLHIQEEEAKIYMRRIGNNHRGGKSRRREESNFRNLAELAVYDEYHGRGRRDKPRRQEKREKRTHNQEREYPLCDLGLFTEDDVARANRNLVTIPYNEWFDITPKNGTVHIRAKAINMGHVFGSAGYLLEVLLDGKVKRIFYTGDVGRGGGNLLEKPQIPVEREIDYLVIESTYGGREHENLKDQKEMMEKAMKKALTGGGKVIVPSFALERTQEFLMYLYEFVKELNRELPRPVTIINDSNLAVRINKEVFAPFLHEKASFVFPQGRVDERRLEPYHAKRSFFAYEHFIQVGDGRTREKILREIYKQGKYDPCIIVSSAGMCEHGPVREHLRQGLQDHKNLILLIGYMAENTLGKRIWDAGKRDRTQDTVKMSGVGIPVNARVLKVDIFSSHADGPALVHYAQDIPFRNRDKAQIVLVHGNIDAISSLRENMINKIHGIDPDNIIIANQGQRILIF